MRITIIYEHNGEGQSIEGITENSTAKELGRVLGDLIDLLDSGTQGKAEILGIETEVLKGP